MKKIIGLGAGGHAKVMIEIMRLRNDFEITGALDKDEEKWGKKLLEVPILGGDDLLPKLYNEGIRWAFVGVGMIGSWKARIALYDLARDNRFDVPLTIHPAATVSVSSEIGRGVTIMAGAIVNSSARIGENAIINTGAIVEHDCVLGNHVHIATGAKLASSVIVGNGTHIGVGATVRECIKIGKNVLVGAGAVVVSDVPRDTTVIGVPAKPWKMR